MDSGKKASKGKRKTRLLEWLSHPSGTWNFIMAAYALASLRHLKFIVAVYALASPRYLKFIMSA